jgi:DNA-binding IclR family transcriptional regulator
MKVVNPLLERCFQLIEFLAEEPRAFRLGVISEKLGLQKGSVHRLLTALCGMGWVEQEPETGFYRLTLRLAIMGQRVLIGTRIPDVTRPILQKLAEESQELVRMAILEGDRSLSWVVYVQGRRTGLIYQPEMIGRVPLTVTSHGKAWLSTLPREEAMRIVREEGFPEPGRFGPRAIQSIDAFAAALDETRARGWGMSYEEGDRGIAAIAAPIRPSGPNTPAVATCSVAGPLMRFGAEDIVRNASLVMAAANEIAAIWPLRSLQTQTDLAAARQLRDDSRVASPIAYANGSYIDQR